MKTDFNETKHWRARQIIGTAVDELELNGNCMLIAFNNKNWDELKLLYKESSAAMKKLGKVLNRKVESIH